MLPTPRAILLALFAAPLIALGTWIPGAIWLATGYLLLILGLLALDWWQAGSVRSFDVSRQHDTKLSLGAENPITLRVYNRGQRAVALSLRDEPPEAFIISLAGTQSLAQAAPVSANVPVTVVEAPILKGWVPIRQTWKETYYVRPLRRGDYRFGDIHLRWRGPLGLIHRQGRIPAANPVKVYPNLLDVRRYDLLLRHNRLQEMGLRHSRLFGQGTEFERLRDYQPDDDFRRINWKATARKHRPITIEYQTERSQNVMAVIDAGRLMQSPVDQIAKLDYVVNAALLLAYVVTGKGDKVGLMTFADDVMHYLSPQSGRGQFYRMLELLYAVDAQPIEPDYRRALNYLAQKQRKRTLIVIFTDLSGGVSMKNLVGQAALLAKRSLPLVVTISDPDIHAAAQQTPNNSLSTYQRMVATQMLDDRQLALEDLQRMGVLTLDVPANQLSMAVINRYLDLKAKTLL
jgi:uncharacterized protein (DUF58 family)